MIMPNNPIWHSELKNDLKYPKMHYLTRRGKSGIYAVPLPLLETFDLTWGFFSVRNEGYRWGTMCHGKVLMPCLESKVYINR